MARLEFRLPSHVVMGEGALEELPDTVSGLGCSEALVVTDPTVKRLYGGRVEEALRRAGIRASFYVITASDMGNVDAARRVHAEQGACAVVGLGGGRSIDVGKYTAYLEGKPFVSVPTAISHDGFASPIVALKDKDLNPVSLFTRPPDAVIVDTGVIAGAPRRLLASGVGDLVAKLTSVADARLARLFKAEEVPELALRMAESAARIVMDNIGEIASWSERGLRLLAEAGLLAGSAMSVAGSSRPCSGAEHLFSHAIDKVYPERRSLHGEQVGVGAIMMAYLHRMDWEAIREALRAVGAPTTAEELGVPAEKVVEALTIAHTLRKRFTVLGEGGLTREAAERLARATGVI